MSYKIAYNDCKCTIHRAGRGNCKFNVKQENKENVLLHNAG